MDRNQPHIAPPRNHRGPGDPPVVGPALPPARWIIGSLAAWHAARRTWRGGSLAFDAHHENRFTPDTWRALIATCPAD
jgi:hypothetical protein